ncbi:MAG: di-heme-cytochrome C peroxidase, partial [Gammaproteobacteria bacterium]
WNGAQSNSGVGALARNVGEVIGVFGEVDTTATRWLGFYDAGYPSSIATDNLRAIEKHVSKLHSPLWPDFFPAIDRKQVAQGRDLFRQHCSNCHLDIDRTDPERLVKVRMSTLKHIQTDPLMAENTLNHRGKSGILQGKLRYYFAGPVIGEEEPSILMLNNLMVGVLKNNPLQAFLAKRDARALGHPEQVYPPKYVDGAIIESGQEVSDRALLAYKARPLNGVWSSAPYLHNGSVPNLYELLLPVARRSQQFYIGSWDYDPVKVGYLQQAQPGAFLFDTGVPGNSNSGHEYGTALSEDQIWALVEYLKTL